MFCSNNKRRHLEVWKCKKYKSVLTLRNKLYEYLHEYFRSNGYIEVHIPVLTRSISSPGALNGRIPSDVDPFRVDYFGREMFLSQSSQLYLEALIKIFPKVFTNMPSFRNEASDFRHLNEFWHIEIEQVDTDLEGIMVVQEDMFYYIVRKMLAKYESDILVLSGKDRIEELQKISKPFVRITYKEALGLLKKRGIDVQFDNSSTDLGHLTAENELEITKAFDGQPVFVTHYPTQEVAFYHKMKPDEKDVVLNADFLAPGYGEVIGSGERISEVAELIEKVERFEMNLEDYQWYVDLREEKMNSSSGFGMGIERFLSWMLKLPDIQHAIAFPRLDSTYLP